MVYQIVVQPACQKLKGLVDKTPYLKVLVSLPCRLCLLNLLPCCLYKSHCHLCMPGRQCAPHWQRSSVLARYYVDFEAMAG